MHNQKDHHHHPRNRFMAPKINFVIESLAKQTQHHDNSDTLPEPVARLSKAWQPILLVPFLIFHFGLIIINASVATTGQLVECKSNWVAHQGGCYKFVTSAKVYEIAKNKCDEWESHLVSLDGEDKHEFIVKWLNTNSKTDRPWYVNSSKELFNSYSTRFFSANSHLYMAANPDLDSFAEFWLDDFTPNNSSMPSHFAYAQSQQVQKKFGLVPIFDQNVRRNFICEKFHKSPLANIVGDAAGSANTNTNHSEGASLSDNSKALFREYPQSLNVVMGSTVEFKCKPMYDDSVIQWVVNDKNLTLSSNYPRYKINDGTLKVEHVRNQDIGNYTCIVSSPSQGRDSRTAVLGIHQLPLPPTQVNAELFEGVGPAVRVFWVPGFDGNTPITKFNIDMRTVAEGKGPDAGLSNAWSMVPVNTSGDQNSVIISNLKPAKKYLFRVRATNRVGTGEASEPTRTPIEVPAQPPSASPLNVVGAPRSPNSITINWSPPPEDTQNGQLVGYKIHHKLAGYEGIHQWYDHEVTNPGQLHFTLDDLIVWQNYEIQVAAANEKGVGPFSSSTYVRTKEGKPDKAPQNVVAEAIKSTAIKVSWDPPPQQNINGINQGYNVRAWYDAEHTKLAREQTVSPNPVPSTHHYIIDNITPFTDYYITVSCFTSAGDGPINDPIPSVRTKQDIPEAVQSLEFADVLDKSLRVVWRPPKQINGQLDHYTLEYYEPSTQENKIIKELPPDMTDLKITELTPQTVYIFKMYAHTIVGQGPVRINQTQTTVPPVLPNPPSNLAFSNIGPTSVMIQFKPGFDGNASIEKWLAEALLVDSRNSGSTSWEQVYISTNHTQSDAVIVRNLQPFTKYRIRLTPVNVVGKSKFPSEPSPEFQTLQMQPERTPDGLSAKSTSSTSIKVQWTPLPLVAWRGHPRGYNLSWAEADSMLFNSSIIADIDADSFVVRGLEEYADYVIRISATNDVGSSPWTTVTERTLEDVPSASPTNLTAVATSSTSISLDWEQVPERHKNGIIRGYKIRYQSPKPGSELRHKYIEDSTIEHAVLNDLTPYTMYHIAICANTSVGEGIYSDVLFVQTLEGLPGAPTNLSHPTVTKTSVRILWDVPENPNGEILGYHISYGLYAPDSRELATQELPAGERSLKVSNLDPNKLYLFKVMAKTKEGWGSPAAIPVYTTDLELRVTLPFYRESWFVILIACLSVVLTIIITAFLFIQNKSYKYKQEAIKSSSSQDRLGDAGFTIDDHDSSHYHASFGLLAHSSSSNRRSNATLSSNVNGLNTLKSPPRPHPGSVAYSDEEVDDDVFEDVAAPSRGITNASNYDSSGESLTEKPSEISSTGPEESDDSDQEDEYINMANKHFVNHYANVNGTLRGGQQSSAWKKNAKSYVVGGGSRTKPKLPQRSAPSVPVVPGMPGTSSSSNLPNATISTLPPSYDTTDRAKADTSNDDIKPKDMENPIVNLNGGRIIVDNMAGSRAPLPGFTSFV